MITIIKPNNALNNCINVGLNCDLIHRGGNGNLWVPGGGFITGLNQNIGSIKTDGVDLTFNWNDADRELRQRGGVAGRRPIPTST